MHRLLLLHLLFRPRLDLLQLSESLNRQGVRDTLLRIMALHAFSVALPKTGALNMNGIIYLVGLVVVVMAVLSVLGLH